MAYKPTFHHSDEIRTQTVQEGEDLSWLMVSEGQSVDNFLHGFRGCGKVEHEGGR